MSTDGRRRVPAPAASSSGGRVGGARCRRGSARSAVVGAVMAVVAAAWSGVAAVPAGGPAVGIATDGSDDLSITVTHLSAAAWRRLDAVSPGARLSSARSLPEALVLSAKGAAAAVRDAPAATVEAGKAQAAALLASSRAFSRANALATPFRRASNTTLSDVSCPAYTIVHTMVLDTGTPGVWRAPFGSIYMDGVKCSRANMDRPSDIALDRYTTLVKSSIIDDAAAAAAAGVTNVRNAVLNTGNVRSTYDLLRPSGEMIIGYERWARNCGPGNIFLRGSIYMFVRSESNTISFSDNGIFLAPREPFMVSFNPGACIYRTGAAGVAAGNGATPPIAPTPAPTASPTATPTPTPTPTALPTRSCSSPPLPPSQLASSAPRHAATIRHWCVHPFFCLRGTARDQVLTARHAASPFGFCGCDRCGSGRPRPCIVVVVGRRVAGAVVDYTYVFQPSVWGAAAADQPLGRWPASGHQSWHAPGGPWSDDHGGDGDDGQAAALPLGGARRRHVGGGVHLPLGPGF